MFEPLTVALRNGLTVVFRWHCKLTTSFSHGQIFSPKKASQGLKPYGRDHRLGAEHESPARRETPTKKQKVAPDYPRTTCGERKKEREERD